MYEQEMQKADEFKYEVWIGEWSLATDKCAHWLGGFNDGTDVPQHECQRVWCPKPYMPSVQDFDREARYIGPYGSGNKTHYTINQGRCSKDSTWFINDEVAIFSRCALSSFDKHVKAQFLWTAHTELEERWDYIRAWDLGWINGTRLSPEKEAKMIEAREESRAGKKLDFI